MNRELSLSMVCKRLELLDSGSAGGCGVKDQVSCNSIEGMGACSHSVLA